MVLAHVVMTACLWPLIPSSTDIEIETDTSNRFGPNAVQCICGSPQETMWHDHLLPASNA